jgi:hypothetical protein
VGVHLDAPTSQAHFRNRALPAGLRLCRAYHKALTVAYQVSEK